MATSKTLTPTNVTIQIPAFTDKPDQRVNSNCIDKEADAINALSDQIGNITNDSWYQKLTTGKLMEARVEAGSQPTTINDFYHGLTYVSQTSQGAPVQYCIILAFSVATYVFQLAFPVNTTQMYIRSGSTSGNWGNWKQIST